MNKEEFNRVKGKSNFGIDYSSLTEGSVVEFPLQGRTPKRMQLTLLLRAKRSGWLVETTIMDDKLFVYSESLDESKLERFNKDGISSIIDCDSLSSMSVGECISVATNSRVERYKTQRMVHAHASNYSKKFKTKTSDGILYVKRIS